MADKHYVYGCSHLLENLRDLISVAARFEEEDKSIEEWLSMISSYTEGVGHK